MKALSVFFALALALFGLALIFTGCGHLPPNVQRYGQAFKVCLISKGLDSAGDVGNRILQILESGGFSTDQLVTQVEAIGISAGGALAEDVITCSVEAWFNLNPVVPNLKPTPSQAASRVLLARHAKPAGAHR